MARATSTAGNFPTGGKMPVVYISLTLLCWQIWGVGLPLNWYGWVLSPPSPVLNGVLGVRHGEIILQLPAEKLCSSHTVDRSTCFDQSALLDGRSIAETPSKKMKEISFNWIPSSWIFISTLFQRVQENSKATEGVCYSEDKRLPSSLKKNVPHFS